MVQIQKQKRSLSPVPTPYKSRILSNKTKNNPNKYYKKNAYLMPAYETEVSNTPNVGGFNMLVCVNVSECL